ncbi:hypothetical protein ACFSTE_17425 [Aquimarina hainanensis]|uniref:Uncharacterized protein n=1 Tax=Aquimarina hainanensis TaxID=1578017 RepID=A0ABW5NDX1_9FLAO|nr:hypothetical protein [Aquimarina sp. TRL1]QKX06881.1 hypothetical protein HN014_18810 [Aquimarina sp. TRL1]
MKKNFFNSKKTYVKVAKITNNQVDYEKAILVFVAVSILALMLAAIAV